jgi:ribosome recycling factor
MGMDIYGLKPKVKGKRPEIDWNKPTTEEERKKYFKKLEKFEAENVGYYFRNNVWFWRPLANLITVLNEEWLTEEQKERLQDNSGFEFSEEEAIKIKLSLEKAINSGWLKKAEKQWKKKAKQAELWNAQMLQDLSQKLLKLFKSNETRVVELVASGEDTEATLILFFDKMTWRGS